MRFRRGGSFRRTRRPREPVAWFRQEISVFAAPAFNTPLALEVFDPSVLVVNPQDLRLTLRRLKLEIFPTVTFSAAAAQGIILGLGVYMTGSAAGLETRDPLFTVAEDQETDWLYLAHTSTTIPAGASVGFFNSTAASGGAANPLRGTSFDALSPDIRAMRKLDMNQTIAVSVNLKRLDAATFAAPTQTRFGFVVDVSALYSRTMK